MLVIGSPKDFTLNQIEDLIETGETIYCEDYELYKIFRDRGTRTDLVYRHPGGITFYNNLDEECKDTELVIPCNLKLDKTNPIWRKYKIFQMKGGYYG